MTLDPRYTPPDVLAAANAQQVAANGALLAKLRAEQEAARGRTGGEVARDAGVQLLQGAVGLGQAAYGVGNMATAGMLDRATGFSGNFNETNQILNSWKSNPTQAAVQRGQAAFKEGIGTGIGTYITDPALLQDLFVSNLASILPAAGAASSAARAAAALPKADAAYVAARAGTAASRMGGAQAGGAANVEILNAAREAGMSDTEGQLAALGGGVATGLTTHAVTKFTGAGALEGMVAAKMAGAKGMPIANLATSILKGGAREGVEESIQSGAETAIQNVFTGKDVGEGVGQSAALGGIAGTMLGGAFGASLRNNTPARQELNTQLADAAAATGSPLPKGALSTPAPQGSLFADVPQTAGAPQVTEEQRVASAVAKQEATVARVGELTAQIAQVNGLLRDPTLPPAIHYALRDELAQAQIELDKTRLPSSALNAMGSSGQQQLGLHIPTDDTIGVTEPYQETIDIGTPEQYDPLAQGGEQLDLLGDPAYYTQFAQERAAAAAQGVQPTQETNPAIQPDMFGGFTDLQRSVDSLVQAPRAGVTPMNFGEFQRELKSGRREKVAEAVGMTEEQMQATSVPIQQAIVTQQQAKLAGIPETSIATAQDIAREQVLAGLVKDIDENGNPVYTRVTRNEDLQTNEITLVTEAEIDDEAKKLAAHAEHELDIKTNWVPNLKESLGLQGNSMKGAAKFLEMARTRGVDPSSPEAQALIDEYLDALPDNATLNKFDTALLNKHRPEGEPTVTTDVAPDLTRPVVDVPPAAGAAPATPVTKAKVSTKAKVAPVPSVAAQLAQDVAPQPPAAEGEVGEFSKPGQLFDDQTYTQAGHTVVFRKTSKDTEDNEWTWNNPATGESGSFVAGSRADAQTTVKDITDQRVGEWGVIAEKEGQASDLTAEGNRTTFSNKQFSKEANRAIKLAQDDDEETPHGAFLDYVLQAFDAIVGTDALAKAKDYAIKDAKTRFGTGEDALTKSGIDRLVTNIAEEYNLRHGYITGKVGGGSKFVDDAKFSLSGKGKAVHTEVTPEHLADVANTVNFANNNRTDREGEIKLFSTVAEYLSTVPLHADGTPLLAVPADAKGIYLSDGSVILIAENLADAKDAASTILHERTHEGLHGLLGDSTSAVTNRLWANAALRKRLKEKMDLGLSRDVAAEEVLTDMQERGEKLNGDVMSKIKTGITKMYHKFIGIDDIVVSNADVDALLNDVVKYRTQGISNPSSRMTYNEAMEELDSLIGKPDLSTAQTARFSRALEDLGRLAGDSDAEIQPNGSKIIGGAAKDVMGFVTGLFSAMKDGQVGSVPRHLYKFLGPTQLHASFNELWNETNEDGTKSGKNAYSAFIKNYSNWADERQRRIYEAGEITRAIEDMRRTNPDKAKTLNALIQYSTFYQVWPGVDAVPTAPGVDPVERAEAIAHINRMWSQVGKSGQEVFNKVQGAYRKAFLDRYTEIKNTLAAVKGVDLDTASEAELHAFQQEFGARIDTAIHRIKHAPYSPLKRFGNYMVEVRDDKGKQIEFTGHDSEREAVKFAADQRARYGSTHKVSTTQRSEFHLEIDGVDQGLINKINNGVRSMFPVVEIDPNLPADKQAALKARNKRNRETQSTTYDALLDAYLHSIPEHSLMQGANARKYVAGFPLDAGRAFNSYMMSFASNVANIKFNKELSANLADMESYVRKAGEGNDKAVKMMNVMNAVKGQYEGTKKVEFNPIAEGLSMASFVYMMTSPSQIMLNGLQTPMVAMPRMAAQFGAGKTTKYISEATKQFASKDGILGDKNLDPRVKGVLDELHQTGMDDFTLAATMAGLAEGNDSDMHTSWRTMMKAASYGMHKSEVFNRQVTAHAFARLVVDKNPNVTQDELLAATRDFIDNQSHFNYDPHNSPEMMQGPWKKAIWQFQKYRLNMLALLARDVKNAEFGAMFPGGQVKDAEQAALARKTLAWTLGTQLALTGAAGTTLSPVLFFLADMFKDDDDLLDSRTNFIQTHGTVLSHGLIATLGIDPSRVESGSILPFLGDRQYVPKDKTAADEFNYYLARFTGPSGAMVKKAWSGANAIAEGEYGEAVKQLTPKPVGDIYSAAADFDGVKNKQGVVYYQPTAGDSLKTVLGLKSADRLEAEEQRGAVYQAQAHAKALAKRALGKVAYGHATGDDELYQEGVDKFLDLQQRHPELIKGSDLKRVIAGVSKAQYNADMYGVPQQGKLSNEVLDLVGEGN